MYKVPVMNFLLIYLKLKKHDALCALHVGGHLQWEKCVCSLLILSTDEYSGVLCAFKDLGEGTASSS